MGNMKFLEDSFFTKLEIVNLPVGDFQSDSSFLGQKLF